MTALALFLPLPDATVDLTSWNHWRLPVTESDALPTDDDFGPVLVTVEYQVASQEAAEFLKWFVNTDGFGAVTVREGGTS